MSIDWEGIRADVDRMLAVNEDTVAQFRIRMSAIFRAMLEKLPPPYKRRPIASMRLICGEEVESPASKVIVHPGWSPGSKTVNLDRIEVELLQEELGLLGDVKARKFDRRMSLTISNLDMYRVKRMHSTGTQDILKIIKTMGEFVHDHHVVLARSHDNCCCCGKALRDELSRSRGIGPECIKTVGLLVYGAADWNGLVLAQVSVEG